VLTCGSTADAWYDNWKRNFERQFDFMISKKPSYRWGGYADYRKGVDCSGYISICAKWSGLPTKRTTSLRMSMGADGWIGQDVKWEARHHLDLVFWSFPRKNGARPRPNGHVGIVWKPTHRWIHNKGNGDLVSHASPSRNHVVVDHAGKGYLRKHITKLRRLGPPKKRGPRR
jgi:cell wall-associated NlpC family hydrolase